MNGRCTPLGPPRRPMSQRRRKPTEGFEPSTPALRERCSGQLSYVGVGGECSRGLGFSRHGFGAEYSCCARVLGEGGRAGLGTVAESRRAPNTPLPLGAYLRNEVPGRPLLAR